MHMWHMDVGDRLPTITETPRHAGDDEIRFEGAKGTLFVPFGRGQEVYDAILAAIATRKR